MHTKTKPAAIEQVEALAHTDISLCYQCGKCSAGCPMSENMDVLPSTIMRLLQCGEIDKATKSAAVWQCVSCQTCSTRCPKTVNIAGVMDALKQISCEKKAIHPDYQRVVLFQKTFLDTIRRNGRTNELELVAGFKIRGLLNDFNPFLAMKDAILAPKMIFMGKLHLKIGSPVKDKGIVRRIFERCS
ncbi:MAG: 4Fe-4S dicluster domain-containing protein [Thermoguttaceae bacterium]